MANAAHLIEALGDEIHQDESDTRHSMVTVRLSDTPVASSSEISPKHQITEAELAQYLPETQKQELETSLHHHHKSVVSAQFLSGTEGQHTDLGESNSLETDEDAIIVGEEIRNSSASMASIRSRSDSSGSTLSSNGSVQVDWEELEKSEEQAPRDEGSDESTAFLLARLEQENNALATNPKAALTRARSTRKGTKTRPPSIQHLKKLVNEPTRPSLRYSLVPDPPPMTELEFWAALVNDYPQTAQRLPTLTSNKIRNGVPPPLRGMYICEQCRLHTALLRSQSNLGSGMLFPPLELVLRF